MKRGPLILIGVGVAAIIAGSGGLLVALRASQVPDLRSAAVLSPRASTSSVALPSSLSPTAAGSRANLAGKTAATVPLASAELPVARISIPRIGVHSAPIYDRGVTSKGVMLIAAGYAVTHYVSSAPLGSGNAVLYGHDDIQGNIFGHLYDLAVGDVIQITVGGATQVYRVTSHQIVPPNAVGVLNPTPDVRLTIITCWPFNVDTKRWIVTAVRI